MEIDIKTIVELVGLALTFIAITFGAWRLRIYIVDSMKKGAMEASSAAANEWKSVADSRKGRIEELNTKIDVMAKDIHLLTIQDQEKTKQIEELHNTIQAMTGVDGVAKMLIEIKAHFDEKVTIIIGKQDTAISLLKGSKNVVNVNTK